MNTPTREHYEDRLARAITARLSDTSNHLPNDIAERLKAARMQAVARRKVVKLTLAAGINAYGHTASLHLDEAQGGFFWSRLTAFVSLFALVLGLLVITTLQDEQMADDIAAVDVELLADDLPPDAYTDPGFLHFLRMNHRD